MGAPSRMYWSFVQNSWDKMAARLADDFFKCIFFNENDRISIQICSQESNQH